MDNANVIVSKVPIFNAPIPTCSRGHDEIKMIASKDVEGVVRFLCGKCLMRTWVVDNWLAELIVEAISKP